jgi:signal transduction histidine kinase
MDGLDVDGAMPVGAACASSSAAKEVLMTLSSFIASNLDDILVEWEKFAVTLPPMAQQKTAVVRDHAKAILSTIAADMREPQSHAQQEAKSKGRAARVAGSEDTAAEKHGAERFAEGLNVNQMVAEYRALRASVIRLWAAKNTDAKPPLYELTRFNEGIDQALAESLVRFSAQLDRSRELLMGVLGHDLRNPLHVMLQSAQILAMQPHTSPEVVARVADRIINGGQRAEQLVADLLDVTRTRLGGTLPLAPAATDLRDVCRRAADETRARHPDRSVTLQFQGDVTGEWDSARLVQLLSNLLENGLRHGGSNAAVTVTASRDDDWVVLEVHNNGNAIPAAIVHRVFDVLFQADDTPQPRDTPTSLGLGLYICRAVAEAHGGSIDVESTTSAGTTFTVYLPRHRERKQAVQ